MGIFSLFNKRKIKEVEKWSGLASNYDSPQTFARSSLLNFNVPEEEWSKDLIALPVRSQDDSKDIYIKQAVQNASGENGITRIQKPSHVSQEEFDKQISLAANEIINAYRQWDGIAPDSIYELAGKDAPKERSVAFYDIFEKIEYAMQLSDMAEESYTMLIDIYYNDDNGMFFALGVRDGKLVKLNISVTEDDIMLGEFEELVPEPEYESEPAFEMASRTKSNVKVYRTKDGKKRWLAIASVATLNRVNEIDSTKLYNSFIRYAEITGKYPILNIYHLGDASRVGQADLLARDNLVYIATGTFDENKFADAVYSTLQREAGVWGNSIEFLSFVSAVESFNVNNINFQARVHTLGINTGISILLEKDAASILTAQQDIKRGGISMNMELRDKLLQLFDGDEDSVSEFLSTVDGANEIATTRINRSTEEVVETVEDVVEEVEPVVETETEVEPVVEELSIELGEDFVRDLTSSEEFKHVLATMLDERFVQFEQRMNTLETEQAETREWVEDVPAIVTTKKRAVVSFRPRAETTDETETSVTRSYAELADETINNIFD